MPAQTNHMLAALILRVTLAAVPVLAGATWAHWGNTDREVASA